MFFRNHLWRAALAVLLGGAAFGGETPPITQTADGFPNRPIRIVVYTSPGGLIDFTAREFARIARKHYPDQPFVVINKPGGGGIVAFEEVLQMPADGHTLLAVTRSNISKLVATGRDGLIDQLDWHSYLMDNAHVVMVNLDEGLSSWQDVVAAAEERGNSIWVGVDIGGVKHVSGVKVGRQAGVEVRWIPFASGGQAVAALLGGMGSAYLGNPRDAVGRDNLRIVGVCAPQRLKDFPEAPTFAEIGIGGLENERIWRGFALRQGVPEPVRAWHAEIVQRVVSDPEWKATWANEGLNLEYRGAEEFAALVQADREEFRFYLGEMGLLKKTGAGNFPASLGQGRALLITVGVLAFLNAACYFCLRRGAYRAAAGEFALTGLLLSLAFLLFVLTRSLPPASVVDPVGAVGVPLLWIGLLVPLVLYQVFRLARGVGGEAEGEWRGGAFLIFIGALAAYAALVPVLGYHLASLLYLPGVVWFLGFRRPIAVGLITVGWLLFTYFVFQRLLYVDLPAGIFFS